MTGEPLACGHPDDDPHAWHWNTRHGENPVCSRCCTYCNTGMGRTATGIDLDPRSAHLALERVGMFLDIDHPNREATA